MTEEGRRLEEARQPQTPWKKWGPYLSERQWGKVRGTTATWATPGVRLTGKWSRSTTGFWPACGGRRYGRVSGGCSRRKRFVGFAWAGSGRRLLVTVNYGPTRGQCYVRVPDDFGGGRVILSDVLDPTTTYEREGDDLRRGRHVFEVGTRTDEP